MQVEDSTTTFDTTPETVADFNHLVSEVLVLGDKLYTESKRLHDKARHRLVLVCAGVSLMIVNITFWNLAVARIPDAILMLVAGWIAYVLIERFFFLFNADDGVQVSMQVLKKSTIFRPVSTCLVREYQVFMEMLGMLELTASALYKSGDLSELRWQTVKLHLSRYGI